MPDRYDIICEEFIPKKLREVDFKMEVKYEAKITAVGRLAREFLENNKSFILLNEKIRPNLADMVVEHTAAELTADIAEGDKLKVGNTDFKVIKVGADANKNMRAEGHCTVVVNADGTMPGQIVVKGSLPPRLRPGDEIKFYA